MFNTSSAIDELVDEIYETLERPKQWPNVFDRMSTCLGVDVIVNPSILAKLCQGADVFKAAPPTSLQPVFTLAPKTSSDHILMDILETHVRRVVYLRQMLVQRKQQAESSIRMLDSVRTGVVMARADGDIVYINSAARGLLSSSALLTIRMNRIWSPNQQKHQQLKSAIDRILTKPLSANTEQKDRHLVLHSQKAAVYVHLSQIANPSHSMPWITQLQGEQALVIVQLTALNQGLSNNARQQLLSLYALSKAELNIAALVAEGRQVNEISALLQLSANTIRAQLKAIYKKTNTRRQAELMQLLLRFD